MTAPDSRLRALIEAARRQRVLRQQARWPDGAPPRARGGEDSDTRRAAWRAYFSAVEDDPALHKATAALSPRRDGRA